MRASTCGRLSSSNCQLAPGSLSGSTSSSGGTHLRVNNDARMTGNVMATWRAEAFEVRFEVIIASPNRRGSTTKERDEAERRCGVYRDAAQVIETTSCRSERFVSRA